jgi:hypothetical protein
MQAGAFLDATVWRTVALAARSNAGAWAAAARDDGGNTVPPAPAVRVPFNGCDATHDVHARSADDVLS